MAFIKTTTNKEGRTHVYLVEGYRKDGKVKQRILKKFGLLDELELEEPGILERLKREAKEGLLTDPKILKSPMIFWLLCTNQISLMDG